MADLSQQSSPVQCMGCGKDISSPNGDGLINFADSLFHTECFKCSKCDSLIDFENNVVLIGEDGKAVCVNCSFKCKLCGEPILEEAITTDEDTYHMACFRCAKCNRSIGDYSFFHADDKLWCTDCHAESVQKADGSNESLDSFRDIPPNDIASSRGRMASSDMKKEPSVASSLTSMPGISHEEYILQLERELEERSRQLSNTEATLIKFKSTSKKALEEFRQVNEAHQKECLRRQQAEAKMESLQSQMQTISRADTRRERTEENIERLNHEVQFLLSQRTAAQKDVEELTAKKETLSLEFGKLVANRHLSTEQLSTNEPDIDRTQEFTRELNQIKANFREEVSALQSQRDAIRTEVEDLRSQRDTLFNEITVLKDENKQLQANRERISEALIGSAEHLDAFEELQGRRGSIGGPRPGQYPEMEELERTVSMSDNIDIKPLPMPPPRTGRPMGPRGDSRGSDLGHPLPPSSSPSSGALRKSESAEQNLTAGGGGKKEKWTKDWKTNLKATTTKLKKAIPQKPPPAAHTSETNADSTSGNSLFGSGSGMFKLSAKKALSKSDGDLTRSGAPTPTKGDVCPSHAFSMHSYRSPRKCDFCGDKLWGKEMRCDGCGFHCHQKCASQVLGQCYATTAEYAPLNAPEPGAAAKEPSTFGVPLAKLLEQEGSDVPRVVIQCIYRKSGPLTQINRIIAAIDKGDELDLMGESHELDITAVTSVLKQFFRDLPEPLLTTALYKNWTDVVRSTEDQTVRMALVIDLLKQLPPAHLTTLAYLMLHLDRIQLHSAENLMTPTNLGVVFGPSLLRPAHQETLLDMAESSAKNSVVEFLVRNAKQLFNVDPASPPHTEPPPEAVPVAPAALQDFVSPNPEKVDEPAT
ncbi:hypothetical protein PhCBS80983_g03210 [Powellomyces hirtus]|uniref:RhoGAP-domain-containing protein n=1 Tax=Powellomyces hirtus TaxID=109895 RepID=A0A507E4J6_9FUNG|nr:hypothetical protein PhCBS80983_g03210 [Powellomyces hirtus]